MKMGWLSLVKTMMIKMEKVWSNLTDSSSLNAECIDSDSQVEVMSFQPLSGEIRRARESIHHHKDIVALYHVNKFLTYK